MNNRIRNQKGISLISLIITIIVIIILAAIVIFEGFGATESAEFARFAQEFSDYQERVSQEYREKKTNNAINKIKKKDSEIYSEMGSPAGTVIEVLDGVELQEPLKGTNCYQLTLDKKIYDTNERVYVTDKGEVFTLPGYEYETNGETRWYVNSTKYYEGEGSQGGQIGPNPYEDMKGYLCDVGDYTCTYYGRDRQGNNLLLFGFEGFFALVIDLANSTLTPSQLATKLTNNFEQIAFYNDYELYELLGDDDLAWEEFLESVDYILGYHDFDEYTGPLFENGRNPFIAPGFEGSRVRALTLDDMEYNNQDGWWYYSLILLATPENNGLLTYEVEEGIATTEVVSEGIYPIRLLLVVPPHIALNLYAPPAPM